MLNVSEIEEPFCQGYSPMIPSQAKLFEAVKGHDAYRVGLLLNEEPYLLERPWAENYRPLHWAVVHQSVEAVKLLIRLGADTSQQLGYPSASRFCPYNGDSNVWFDWAMNIGEFGRTPRDLAVESGNVDLIRLFGDKEQGRPL